MVLLGGSSPSLTPEHEEEKGRKEGSTPPSAEEEVPEGVD